MTERPREEEPQRRRAGSAGFAVRRPERRSPWRLALRAGGLLLVLAAAVLAAWWLRTSPTFHVTRIESGAYRFTDEQQLQEILSGFLGRNIWTLRDHEVKQALARLPWVRDLRVRRRLPAQVEVDFREWRPLLEVADASGAAEADGGWVLVGDGRVLPFPAQLARAGLPVLTGVACAVDSSGTHRLPPELQRTVLELVQAIESSGLEAVSPIDFVVARPEGFAIVLQGGVGRLLVGREQFADRLGRYLEAHVHLEPGLIVDLRFADRVTCRRPQQP